MRFESIDEVQAFLDRTATSEDRLQTILVLLGSRFAELRDQVDRLNVLSDRMKSQGAVKPSA